MDMKVAKERTLEREVLLAFLSLFSALPGVARKRKKKEQEEHGKKAADFCIVGKSQWLPPGGCEKENPL